MLWWLSQRLEICKIGASFDCLVDSFDRNCSFDHPFYIFDIGVGNGKFAQYFLLYLHELLRIDFPNTPRPTIIYVGLDISPQSFDIWSEGNDFLIPEMNCPTMGNASVKDIFSHQEVDKFVWLDFALYDAECDEIISLTRSQITISRGCRSINPIIAIGNYLFDRWYDFLLYLILDSLSADAFTVFPNIGLEIGDLFETRLLDRHNFLNPKSYVDHVNDSQKWIQSFLTKVSSTPSSVVYYEDSSLDNTIASLAYQLTKLGPNSSTFTIPIGGLRCLERIRELSQDNCLISLLADKSYHR